ncbi:PTS sugar transporter subunit IIA [Cohnella thermotolerans]|uniref:PTS sugar transporter subunit IIA n=1 Tax=Cohnella thermotolerans TaxID=329858 RepID=UPI0004197FAE|nr:fructose PTS transporter subunit IIA [Cohnella thermotolerans]
MQISSLLQEQAVLIPLNTADKQTSIEAMVDALAAGGSVTDRDAYLQAILAREQTGSTGIGFGFAIPHGKSAGVSRAALAFAKFARPVDWDSLDGNPVQAAFMIAVPAEAAGNEHLQILIALSRKLIHEEFREQLLQVQNAEQLTDLLETI